MPHPQRPVLTATDDPPTVGAEGDAVDLTGVPLSGRQDSIRERLELGSLIKTLSSLSDVPHTHDVELAQSD